MLGQLPLIEQGIAVILHWKQAVGLLSLQIYQSFYCRMNDPSYIKDLKLQLLSAVADDSNAYEIVTELTEYVTDIDEHLAREAVRAVGRIALEVLFFGFIFGRNCTMPQPYSLCHSTAECGAVSCPWP